MPIPLRRTGDRYEPRLLLQQPRESNLSRCHLHVRGAETAPQYVLDGVPLADKLTGTYATGMDA
jgi:hypothetical protein